MDYHSLIGVLIIMVFGVLLRVSVRAPRSSPPVRSRYDLLESEIARLQAENAQLAVKAAKTEYR